MLWKNIPEKEYSRYKNSEKGVNLWYHRNSSKAHVTRILLVNYNKVVREELKFPPKKGGKKHYLIYILERKIFVNYWATMWEVRVEARKPGRRLLSLVQSRETVSQSRMLEIL